MGELRFRNEKDWEKRFKRWLNGTQRIVGGSWKEKSAKELTKAQKIFD